MIRKLKILLLSIFLIFLNINIVFADQDQKSDDCGQIDKKINQYNNYTESLSLLDCEDTSNSETVRLCNDYKMNRNIIITQLMKENEKGNICEEKKKEVDKIIEENSDRCGKIFDASFSNFVNGFMTFFYILGPILLIFFGSLDYTKAVVSSDAEAMKKANKNFAKRLTATILLFLSPVIVNIIIDMNVSNKYLSGNAYSCDFEYKVYTKKYNIRYVPRKKSSKPSSGGSTIGDYILYAQCDSAWGSEQLINGTSTVCQAGCAVTAVSMQMVNSGVVSPSNFSPSVLNASLREHTNSGSAITWSATNNVASNFVVHQTKPDLTGDINSKASQLKTYLDSGYYPVIQVKYGTATSSHYVAVFEVNGNEILIGDPNGGTLTILNNTQYPIATKSYASQLILYKVQ